MSTGNLVKKACVLWFEMKIKFIYIDEFQELKMLKISESCFYAFLKLQITQSHIMSKNIASTFNHLLTSTLWGWSWSSPLEESAVHGWSTDTDLADSCTPHFRHGAWRSRQWPFDALKVSDSTCTAQCPKPIKVVRKAWYDKKVLRPRFWRFPRVGPSWTAPNVCGASRLAFP